MGRVSYCGIESFGSIARPLFWAFTNSTPHNLEGAKARSLLLMVAARDLGSIAGPTLVSVGTHRRACRRCLQTRCASAPAARRARGAASRL